MISNLWYMARRFKMATALNLVGLVVAFAAFYFVMTQVEFYNEYNSGLKDSERLYRVEQIYEGKWVDYVSRPMASIAGNLPMVEDYGEIMASWSSTISLMKGETEMRFPSSDISARALKMLATVVSGSIDWTDERGEGLIINASIAKSLFGTTDAAGKSMRTSWGWEPTVVAVIEDFPENSIMQNSVWSPMNQANMGNESNLSYNCIVKLREGADPAAFEQAYQDADLREWQEWKKWKEGGGGTVSQEEEVAAKQQIEGKHVRLTPLSETYFSGVDSERDRGNRSMMIVLRLICVLAIVVAAINFLNFTLAESPMRIRSVNTRRVLGCKRGSLRAGLIGESVLTALIAVALAIGVCYLLSRSTLLGELLTGSLSLKDHLGTVGLMLLLAVVTGLIAGVYPAYYVTSFTPALVLKGSFGLSPKGRKLRSSLVCLQLVVSLVMAIYLGVLLMQSRYIFRSDYGFEKDEILLAEISGKELWQSRETLRDEVARLTGVEDAAYSQFVIATADVYMGWSDSDGTHNVSFTCLPVDWHYLRTMGIDIVEGRDFNEHDACGRAYIINEAARKTWDWVRLDQPILDGDSTVVVGVCKNFRLGTVRADNASKPVALWLRTYPSKTWDVLGQLNIRVSKGVDKLAVREKIVEAMKHLGKPDPTVEFLDRQLETTYKEESLFVRQVLVFSVLCLLITLIGVFCLTMFETEHRRKEIGIRKVFGSTTRQVLQLFCRKYVWYVVFAFVVAAPVAWFLSRSWLENFAERAPLPWWMFILAFIAVGAITIGTVILQCWKTANENPVNSIKNE